MKPSDINGPVAYATVPTPLTQFWRTFVPYQLLRLLIINVKILRLIAKLHTPPPQHPEEKPAQQGSTH